MKDERPMVYVSKDQIGRTQRKTFLFVFIHTKERMCFDRWIYTKKYKKKSYDRGSLVRHSQVSLENVENSLDVP